MLDLVKRITLIGVIFLFGLSKAYSQDQESFVTFSSDSAKFIKQLNLHFEKNLGENDKEAADKILKIFISKWQGIQFSVKQQSQVVEVCNALLLAGLKPFPYFTGYFSNMLNLLNSNATPFTYNSFHRGMEYCLKTKNFSRNLIYFNERVNLVFEAKSFNKTKTDSWRFLTTEFTLTFDTVPVFVFPKTDLICAMKTDSSWIHGTKGKYYPLTQQFIGQGGTVYWDREGFGHDSVFATLGRYRLNCISTNYIVDTVQFINRRYLGSKPISGRFEERLMADVNPQKAVYPKVTGFLKNIVIQNLFPGIDYEGGFIMEGSKVIGFGDNKDATLQFKQKSNLLFQLRSPEFIIRPDRIVSSNAAFVMYIEDDSIYHPGLPMRYDKTTNTLILDRGEENGLSQSPFFNSYHKVDMYPESLMWKLDDTKVIFGSFKFPEKEGRALFESVDYFSNDRFESFQGFDEVNPLNLVLLYVRQRGLNYFYADEFATYLKKPVDQVRALIIKMANAGFLTYNVTGDVVKVQPRLNAFLASKSKVKDYDCIQFNSRVKEGNNAELDLKTKDMLIRGVKGLILSDSQRVYIMTRDGDILLKKGRDFKFNGRVHAGYFTNYANDCAFEYDKFSLHISKIDSVGIQVWSRETDLYGEKHLVNVKNCIVNLNGDLQIDAPNNKSGRLSLKNYPIFDSKDTSFVYFDKKQIQKGAYSRKNFYFEVYPYVMDSLNSLPTDNLRFDGMMKTGIFPQFAGSLKVQEDYSLGFKRKLSPSGESIYGGLATFYDSIQLNNNGLNGSGRLEFFTSRNESPHFLFTPDSVTTGISTFNCAAQLAGTEFPQAFGQKVAMKWIPSKDEMKVSNLPTDSISLYNKQAYLRGSMVISSGKSTGVGMIRFEDAKIVSRNYEFGHHSFSSDTSDFVLYTHDHNYEAFTVSKFAALIDLEKRSGIFKTTSNQSVLNLPFNQYLCQADEFKWEMDKKDLLIETKAPFGKDKYMKMSQDELLAIDPSLSQYRSTNKKQEGMKFFATEARYDLDSNIFKIADARILRVADAAIFPNDGQVTIGAEGKIQPLRQASLLANTDNRYHKLFGADLSVYTQKNYGGKGLYDYTPADGDIETLEMNTIGVDTAGHTYAKAIIKDSTSFKLNRWFSYMGSMELKAESKELYFAGAFRMNHDCEKIPHEWIKFKSALDPKDIVINIPALPENTGDGKLRVSLMYSLTEGVMKPSFFAKPDNVTDPDIVPAKGSITYDMKKGEYRVADLQKIRNDSASGNLLSLNTQRCILHGEGKMNLTGDMGRLKVSAAGISDYFILNDTTKLQVMLGLQFFFSDNALNVMKSDFNASGQPGVDMAGKTYSTLLKEYVGRSTSEKMMHELQGFGLFRNLPDSMSQTLILTNVNLVWNNELRSFVSNKPFGISNIGNTPINKMVKGYIEIGKRRTGDLINLYMEFDDNHWYFFTYSNGTMQAIGSEKEFNDKLVGLKENDRVIKASNGMRRYQYIIGTSDKKSTFLRKIKQAMEAE